MKKTKIKIRHGLTMIEMIVAAVMAVIIIFGIGIVLADSQKGWNQMYDRIYSDVVNDSYVARKTFDHVIRKASREKFFIGVDGSWLEVYYYSSSGSSDVDSYARFYCTGVTSNSIGQLNVEYGTLDPKQTAYTRTICENVADCVFKSTGRSAQMILTLDNGSLTATVSTSAVLHNQ